jgi:hypothetical protein
LPRPAIDPNDTTIVERNRFARTSATILGRYALASRRNPLGERREFSCRTVEISCYDLAVMVPVPGPIGERVIASFNELGRLEGQIIRLDDDGFVMSLLLRPDQRESLVAKILWLEMRKHLNLPDDRRHRRVIPKHPQSSVMLADGRVCDCFVIDMSVSGAAVSADIDPKIGDILAVGKVVGRVVRIFREGFAVGFIELQDPGALEHLLLRS